MNQAVGRAIAAARPSLSFEFFPPKDEAGRAALEAEIAALDAVEPDFVSITYGAGGSVEHRREQSLSWTQWLAGRPGPVPLAHLTCVGHCRTELSEIAAALQTAGAGAILALRGDPSGGPGSPWQPTTDGLNRAVELVELLQPDWPTIGVAAFPYGHPAAVSLAQDTAALKAKQAAGASFAITQMFFEVAAYQRLLDRLSAAGVDLPVLPGLMPLTSASQIARLEEFSGAPLPKALREQLDRADGDAATVRRIGLDWTVATAAAVLEVGALGLHFYTLNRSATVLQVTTELGLAGRTVDI